MRTAASRNSEREFVNGISTDCSAKCPASFQQNHPLECRKLNQNNQQLNREDSIRVFEIARDVRLDCKLVLSSILSKYTKFKTKRLNHAVERKYVSFTLERNPERRTGDTDASDCVCASALINVVVIT